MYSDCMTERGPALSISDRTQAAPAIEFILDKLSAYDTRLLHWIRVYPMTDLQHRPRIDCEAPPVTMSVCWFPREPLPGGEPPLPCHQYRIKVNIWQGADYPAIERDWGRVPARLLRPRDPCKGFTTRGMCEWRYPDRLSATVHALARSIFLFLAHSRQFADRPSASNASAMGHRWAVEWLRANGQVQAANALSTQLVQWILIQSKGT